MTSPQPLPIPFYEISEKEAVRIVELSLKEFLELGERSRGWGSQCTNVDQNTIHSNNNPPFFHFWPSVYR